MEWDAFQDAHYRPHLIVAMLDLAPDPPPAMSVAALLERLATTLGISGNYATKPDGAIVLAAFELDTDAGRYADVLSAKTTVTDPEWASKSVSRINGAVWNRIMASLRKRRPSSQLAPSPREPYMPMTVEKRS